MDVLLGSNQFIRAVRDSIGVAYSDRAIYRWVSELEMSAPFSLSDVEAIVHYGLQRRSKIKPSMAKTRTINYLRSKAS
jgi:hypothetical protein